MKNLVDGFLPRHFRDLLRKFRNHQYETTDSGIRFKGTGLAITGTYRVHSINGVELPEPISHHNLIPTQGLNYLLSAGLAGGAQVTTWYVAAFANSTATDPQMLAWTAANFAANAQELTTELSNASRPEFVESVPSAGATGNSASPAVVTTAQNSVNIWGLGLLSVATKGSTSGTLLSVGKFAAAYAIPTTGGTLGITHDITLVNQ